MKIAFVIINANRREGTSRAVLEVAERLALRHEVTLLARTVEGADLTNIAHRAVRGPGWPEVADFSSFLRRADRVLRDETFDIVHSAGPNTTRAHVYTIQTVHAAKMKVMSEVGAHAQAGRARRLTRWAYDHAVLRAERGAYTATLGSQRRAFLPVAEGTRAELLGHHPVAEALVEVIPNGADLERFHPRHREKALGRVRPRHGLAANDFVLLFSGGDWRRKGLPLAIEAVARIPDPRVKLLVAGSDPLGDSCRRQVETLGLQKRVVFAGFCEEIEACYAASDLFVFPTAYEAFSLATLEAAASGLPVVMPAVSGAAELVGENQAGLVVERSPEAIAAAILSFVNNPELRARVGARARARVEAHFSWEVIAGRTEAVYNRLMEERRARTGAGAQA